MSGVAEDWIIMFYVRETVVKVGSIEKKVRDKIKWFDSDERRCEEFGGKQIGKNGTEGQGKLLLER